MSIDFLLKAIEEYHLYSASQRSVLKMMISAAIDNVASISVQDLVKKLGLTKSSIYTIIKNLENDDIVSRIRLKNTRQDSYKLNIDKLDYIIQVYNKKKAI